MFYLLFSYGQKKSLNKEGMIFVGLYFWYLDVRSS